MDILLVDDDPGTLNALRIGLISHGFDVLSVESGRRALEMLEQCMAESTPVRLLVTDFRMPGMNGLRLIQEAKRVQPSLLTILITGYGSEGLREDSGKAGVDDYVEKPFAPSLLVQHIQDLLGVSNKKNVAAEQI